jgi:hypothetical protein
MINNDTHVLVLPLVTKKTQIFETQRKVTITNPIMATISMDLKMIFGIHLFIFSFKFYIPFLLVATSCNIIDY